jgi:hypothetical protein
MDVSHACIQLKTGVFIVKKRTGVLTVPGKATDDARLFYLLEDET